MKVARQFIAWDGSKKSVRPVRDGVSRAARELTPKVEERPGDPSNRPSGTGFLGAPRPGISCLATIVWSLRDRSPDAAPTPIRRYAHPSLDS
jgi:hypothetical protein